MTHTHIVFRLLLASLAFALIPGCGYQKPTGYIHFPEYGYLPVIDNGYYTQIVITYVATDFAIATPPLHSGNHIGTVVFTNRESLPQSLESAQGLVDRNMSVLSKSHHSEVAKEILTAPIAMPLAIVYFAPGIAILTAIVDDATSTRNVSRDANLKTDLSSSDERVTIHVVDKRTGQPLSGVSVLPILSPIRFAVYSNDAGCRTYPNSKTYDFHVSNELATLLAEHMLDMPFIGPKQGILTSISTSDDQGMWSHVNDAYDLKSQLGLSEGLSTLYLIAKMGYKATVTKLVVPTDTPKPLELRVELNRSAGALMPERTTTADPWVVIDQLQKQVDYFVQTKYDTRYGPNTKRQIPPPPLDMDKFGELLTLTERVAPDYPLVSMARFFYDINTGRTEEAKTHAAFIDDDVYFRAVYQMSLEPGLPLW